MSVSGDLVAGRVDFGGGTEVYIIGEDPGGSGGA